MHSNIKSMLSVMSTVGSSRASRNIRLPKPTSANDIPQTFEKLLPFVLKKYALDIEVFVQKGCVKDNMGTRSKTVSSRPSTRTGFDLTQLVNKKVTISDASLSNIFQMTALYDNRDSLVEISIQNRRDIPCQLFKIILILAPYFPSLSKITIRNCAVTNNLLFDVNKIQSLNKLTGITLDDSYLYGRNFDILLDQESCLKNLSLNRCNILDEGCKEISIKLKYPNTAERNLVFLSLSGNKITDTGVKYLAEMLRTNRCLRYLNLASNQVADDGVRHLLEILTEFPLNKDEVMGKKSALIHNLNKLKPLLPTSVKESRTNTTSQNKKTHSVSKRSTSKACSKTKFQVEDSDGKVHLIVQHILDQYRDPFSEKSIIRRDGSLYCRGNNILCYLNLAYNDLSNISVKNIADFLQHKLDTEPTDADIIKFRIEGNKLLDKCKEYVRIDRYYQSKLKAHSSRRSSRSRRSVSISKK